MLVTMVMLLQRASPGSGKALAIAVVLNIVVKVSGVPGEWPQGAINSSCYQAWILRRASGNMLTLTKPTNPFAFWWFS
jgi:hypothetical protein